MKHFLVTGGAGFLGSHLVDRLIGDGHRVTVLDSFETGSIDNLAQHAGNDKLTVVLGDVCVHGLPDLKGMLFDGIYHFACRGAPRAFRDAQRRTMLTCSLGTSTVLDYALRCGCPVLLASSDAVYGSGMCPQIEYDTGRVDPTGPISCYSEGKRFAEALATAWKLEEPKANVRIARIFSSYGPRMSRQDGRVIPSFITKALENAPLEILGRGRHTRSFCHVDDTISGVVALMESDRQEPINIGNSDAEVSIVGLAHIIINLTGGNGTMHHAPDADTLQRDRRPSINAARWWLNWTPIISLEDGLERTIDWYRKTYYK